MTDRIVAVLALLALGAFLAVMVVRVRELDLMIVLGFCFLLAVVDAVLALMRRRRAPTTNGTGGTKSPDR